MNPERRERRIASLRALAQPGSGAQGSERESALRELARMGAPVTPPAPRPSTPARAHPMHPTRTRAQARAEIRTLAETWERRWGVPLDKRNRETARLLLEVYGLDHVLAMLGRVPTKDPHQAMAWLLTNGRHSTAAPRQEPPRAAPREPRPAPPPAPPNVAEIVAIFEAAWINKFRVRLDPADLLAVEAMIGPREFSELLAALRRTRTPSFSRFAALVVQARRGDDASREAM